MLKHLTKKLALHAFIFGLLFIAIHQIVKDGATRNWLFIAIFSIAIVANIVRYEIRQFKHFLGFEDYRHIVLSQTDYKALKSISEKAVNCNLQTPIHFFDYDLSKREKEQLLETLKNIHINGN